MKLVLEINQNCIDKTGVFTAKNNQREINHIMVSPPVDENYWLFRIKLMNDQAVLGFPKYGLIGVGMALEEKSGNTNLPTNCGVEKIARHIQLNKKYRHITLNMIREAIHIIIIGAKKYGF